MKVLTESLEDYLETMYILQQSKEDIRITDIALKLGLTKPSVNRAVNTLKMMGLISHQKYGKITLTSCGKEAAMDIYYRHNTLKEFFINVLKMNPEDAERDACRAEHILSPEAIKKVSELCL